MANLIKYSRARVSYLLLFFLIIRDLASASLNFTDHSSAYSSDARKGITGYWTHRTKSGSVRLHPDYDNKTATWTFHFNLLIPKSVDNLSVIFYKIEIHLIDHDTSTWNFYRNSIQRYLVSKRFNQIGQDQRVNVTAICDNAYSGNYSLVIKSCTGESKDDEACEFEFEFDTVEKYVLEVSMYPHLSGYGALQLEPMEQNRTKVLLIYETEDERIQQKALSFRQRLSSEDIAQDYDIGDEKSIRRDKRFGNPTVVLGTHSRSISSNCYHTVPRIERLSTRELDEHPERFKLSKAIVDSFAVPTDDHLRDESRQRHQPNFRLDLQ